MSSNPSSDDTLEIDLRKPHVAALLAWLWPGAGHIYQRRYHKGLLFMVCIVGTFFYGLIISDGHAVYASFSSNDFRWQYICQLGAGGPALPALLQKQLGDNALFASYRDPDARNHPGKDKMPLFLVDPPPENRQGLQVDAPMAPPHQPVDQNSRDMLAVWHEEAPVDLDLGTLFTMIAGLLNVLAIYDAYAGPVIAVSEDDDKDDDASPSSQDTKED